VFRIDVIGFLREELVGHFISAVLLKGPFDEKVARDLGLTPIPLPQGITLFPLHARYCDHWADRLGVGYDGVGRPLLDCRVVRWLVRHVAREPLFAVIETDYFGGRGDQAAVVYRGEQEVMAAEEAEVGPINRALRHLGVRVSPGLDEFDTVGLGGFRHFDELFEPYRG
jgi:hypothetical protein